MTTSATSVLSACTFLAVMFALSACSEAEDVLRRDDAPGDTEEAVVAVAADAPLSETEPPGAASSTTSSTGAPTSDPADAADEPTPGSETDPLVAGGCDAPDMSADVDGDGTADPIYLRWAGDAGAVLGTCVGGEPTELPIPGMAEVLRTVDLDSDGRYEILAGGTSAGMVFEGVYTYLDRRGALHHSSGNTDPIVLRRGHTAAGGATWGCKVVGDQRRIFQVDFTGSGDVLNYDSTMITFSGAGAIEQAGPEGSIDAGSGDPVAELDRHLELEAC